MFNNIGHNKIPAERFFGVKDSKLLNSSGITRLIFLKEAVKEELNFVDLGTSTSKDFFNLEQRKNQLLEFRQKKLAILTLWGDEFKHSPDKGSLNTHTIGLVLNEKPNEYFYKSNPEIIILDSLGCNYSGSREIHQSLCDFMKKEFPHSLVTIAPKEPQQLDDGSLTCLNWALANLKIAKENLGRADIANLLPKSEQINSILEEQKKLLENSKYANLK